MSNPRSQSKRPHKCNDQGIQEQVKPKRAQVKEQTTISGALDRFRFHDAALSEKTVPTHGAEECARDVTTPLVTASNGKQQRQPTQLQRSMLMPQYMDSGFNSRADSTRYPIQVWLCRKYVDTCVHAIKCCYHGRCSCKSHIWLRRTQQRIHFQI